MQPFWFSNAVSAAPDRHVMRVDGVAIEALSWGPVDGPPILLLHGSRAHANWWSHLAPLLARAHRVVAISWSGMGGSAHRASYSVADYAKEALSTTEDPALFPSGARPFVIAHSFGGLVATYLAATQGQRLRGAILIDSALRPNRRPPPPELRPHRPYPTREDAMAHFRLTPAQEALPYVLQWFARHAVKQTPDGWIWRFDPRLWENMEHLDIWPFLARPLCPIALVRGELSTIVTAERVDAQRSHAPAGTRFITIEGAGHHIMADRPLALVETLDELIATWPP